jgi:hypothetical protein
VRHASSKEVPGQGGFVYCRHRRQLFGGDDPVLRRSDFAGNLLQDLSTPYQAGQDVLLREMPVLLALRLVRFSK